MTEPGTRAARLEPFVHALDELPPGSGTGRYRGRRYGVTLSRSADRRRYTLYAEQLGGADRISFNLYLLTSGEARLRPCEMPAGKVIDFVCGYVPDA